MFSAEPSRLPDPETIRRQAQQILQGSDFQLSPVPDGPSLSDKLIDFLLWLLQPIMGLFKALFAFSPILGWLGWRSWRDSQAFSTDGLKGFLRQSHCFHSKGCLPSSWQVIPFKPNSPRAFISLLCSNRRLPSSPYPCLLCETQPTRWSKALPRRCQCHCPENPARYPVGRGKARWSQSRDQSLWECISGGWY